MKIAIIIARSLLGFLFVVFGLNAFFHFIPMPPPTGLAGDFMKALFVSHYFYAIAILQIVGGVVTLAGRTALGLLLLGPVIVNILLFHVFLAPEGLPFALVVCALSLFLLWEKRQAFAAVARS